MDVALPPQFKEFKAAPRGHRFERVTEAVRLPQYEPVRDLTLLCRVPANSLLLLSLISPFCITFLFVCSLLLFFFLSFSHGHILPSSPRTLFWICLFAVFYKWSKFWLCFCQRCALFTQLMTFSLKINERFIQFCNLLITWPEVEKTWALGDLYRQQIKFSSTNNSWTWTSSSALVLFWKEQQGVHSSSEPLSITRSMASRTGGRLGS